jgi:nitroimidazol reductase NimA-like FMN-containing flavoprotein (pyridoxamine 5'-phosphate oxidase superfamily)
MSQRDRTQIRRSPHKQTHDESALRKILSRAILAHVAIVDEGQPICIPVACAPYENEVLLHGSTASRLFKLLASGTPACLTITSIQGLVLARSAFDSSMHYESLIAFGSARVIEGEEKIRALNALTDHLFPERRAELRASTKQELAATTVLAFPLDEVSIKISDNEPEGGDEDTSSNLWIGTVPIISTYGEPLGIQFGSDVAAAPSYISHWPINRI